jgi:16S rRNA (guanine527-N7)-methyltransferase
MRPGAAALRSGLAALSLGLTEAQVDQLLDYQELIQKWNKVYNLTAVRSPAEMLTHHLLDSLSIVRPLQLALGDRSSSRLLDVGSGAGLPGVVVAICCPGMAVDCVDAVAKKAAFIQQAGFSLGLSNLRGVHARVESLSGKYDVICSRAFASLVDFTTLTSASLKDGGLWLAMKGKYPAEEVVALPEDVFVFHVEQLSVPGLDAERCIVWMKNRPTNPVIG